VTGFSLWSTTPGAERLMVGTVFLALAVVVALWSALRYLTPDLDVGALRVRINRLVLAVFLPALKSVVNSA